MHRLGLGWPILLVVACTHGDDPPPPAAAPPLASLCAHRCTTADCPWVILASSLKRPQHLVVDDAAVYWTNLGTALATGIEHDASVMRLDRKSATITVLADGQAGASGIAQDAESIYWTTVFDNAVRKVPKTGGLVTTLAVGEGDPWELAVVGDLVTWTDKKLGTVSVARKDDSAPPIAATVELAPTSIAASGDEVFWIASDLDRIGIYRMPLAAPTPRSFIPFETIKAGVGDGLALDGTDLYWIRHPTHADGAYRDDGAIVRSSITTGAMQVVLDGQAALGHSVAVDDESIYWAVDDDASHRGGLVMRVPKEGGLPTLVAELQANPVAIATDAACVYWLDQGTDGTHGFLLAKPK